jgi:hypothetical protein
VSNVIMEDRNTPPPGWRKLISRKEYLELDDRSRYYYQPVWKKVRTVKRRHYEECDQGFTHFMGWEEEIVGVGTPQEYRYTRPFVPYWPYGINAATVDTVLKSNVITDRVMKRARKHGT